MNKKFFTGRNADLFPLIVERINMLHPAYVAPDVASMAATNVLAHPLGVFLDQSGDFVEDWIPGGSVSSQEDFCTLGALIQAPDGTFTGRKIVEGSTNQEHSMVAGFVLRGGVKQYYYRFKFQLFAKAGERTRITLALADTLYTRYLPIGGQNPAFPYKSGVRAVFDLAGGTVAVGNTAVGTGFEAGFATITKFKRGWCRCTIEATVGALHIENATNYYETGSSGPVNAYMYIDAGSGAAAENTNYAGNGTSGVYVWKANCLPSAAFDLDEQVFFDDFDSNATIDVGDTKAPGFNWYVNANKAFRIAYTPLVQGIDYSVSDSELHFHKPDSSSSVGNWMFSVVNDGTDTGYIGNTFVLPYYIEGRVRSDEQPDNPHVPAVLYGYSYWSSAAEGLFGSVTGPWPQSVETIEWDWLEPGLISFSTVDEIYLPKFNCGQYEISVGPTVLKYPIQGTVCYPYNNKPEFTDHHVFGMLSFPHAAGTPPFSVGQRNVLSNTAWADAVPGSPGTLPANMTITGFTAGGMTVDVVSITAGKLQIRFHGTVTSDQSCEINFASNHPSAGGTMAAGQVWTTSVELRRAAGTHDINTMPGPSWTTDEFNAANVQLDFGGTAVSQTMLVPNTGLPTTLTRVSVTRRLVGLNVARLKTCITTFIFNGQVIDETWEFYQPQMERSCVPTAFQASSGADPVVVQGVTMNDAERFQQRNFTFFDGMYIGDVVTFTWGDLNIRRPFSSFQNAPDLHFPLMFNATQEQWPSHWDWIRVIK